MYETIEYVVANNVCTILLNRPDSLNAFTADMNREITKAIKQAEKDSNVRCIVIKGAGKGFCSGQDLSVVDESMDHGEVLTTLYGPMMKQIYNCEKPIVAGVHGAAAGAGFSLALACDFRIMAEKSFFLNAFVHVGLIPDSGNLYFLKQLVGNAKALEISVLGERILPHDALALGLATKVVANDKFDEEVALFAENIANLPTKAISLMKRTLRAAEELPFEEFLAYEAQGQRIAGLTRDHREGVQAFTEKRKPIFVGE
ncbi:enoyl-CoA hydratase-related protein [Lysinibacillus endophyticus]|uniref:2-(1,2-epoxy-1,2-dihydrophenyl)acetyl-CoA isomerase n=1 Tax=Ureibacillus endophyticus TaxID=1978490 RepID=A0A494Z4U4_9BACL|nr:enoyl-CoA hydratase-related protein [Lysinibacillus endophyticus]MCP1146234.1 enoyl-CoA hydratase-related protein [Lysinibacillus endophyticus]RKQ17023.1 2-(1,2-epoxy-1,2-dihydrophenyl)acetyl-CoA isomerase [Lysinibacillus endophyticus]